MPHDIFSSLSFTRCTRVRSTWDENSAALKEHHPDLWRKCVEISQLSCLPEEYTLLVEDTASSFWNVKIHQRALVGQNPLQSTKRSLLHLPEAFSSLFMLGADLGYLCENFFDLHPEKTCVILEKDIILLFLMLCRKSWASFLQKRQLSFIFLENLEEVKQFSFAPSLKKDSVILINPFSLRLDRGFFESTASLLLKWKESILTNDNTLKHFERVWLRNFIRNSYLYFHSIPLESLDLKGEKVILIGAGASLESYLDLLHEQQKFYTLIVVSTVLPVLLEAGILPDIILCVDPQWLLLEHFQSLFAKQDTLASLPLLIAESTVSPAILRKYKGKILFGKVGFLEASWKAKDPLQTSIPSGGSVLTSAFSLAYMRGASSIAFLGADMSFTDHKSHMNGTTQMERILLEKSHYFSPYLTVSILSRPRQFAQWVWNFEHTEKIPLFYPFATYWRWFEKQFSLLPQTDFIVNASGKGVAFPLLENIAFPTYVQRSLENSSPKEKSAILLKQDLSPEEEQRQKQLWQEWLLFLEEVKTPFQALSSSLSEFLFLPDRTLKAKWSALEEECIEKMIRDFPYKVWLSLGVQSQISKVDSPCEDEAKIRKDLYLSLLDYSRQMTSLLRRCLQIWKLS